MQPKALKYLLDLESLIRELETFKDLVGNDFLRFQNQPVVKRAVERDLEIIGEAVRALLALDPGVSISSSRKIIGLRNLLAHAYDGVEDELIWAILQKDIPQLKREVAQLLAQG